MTAIYDSDLLDKQSTVRDLLARYGVKFGIYKKDHLHEQLFPFDPIPRVIEADEFQKLEKGLKQRVTAINEFLGDIYGKQLIIKDGVIPESFIFGNRAFMKQCVGIVPPKNIHAHISGINLVQNRQGEWFVMNDNIHIPSGASYPMIARKICRRSSPKTFTDNHIEDNRNYGQLLRQTLDYVNTGGMTVILTPGRQSGVYFEHSYLAEMTGAQLVTARELTVKDNTLYFNEYTGRQIKVGALYTRIRDCYLDPANGGQSPQVGVPHIFDAYRSGNLAIVNAPGSAIADNKGIYYYMPQIIRYYLDEEPLLKNAPSYLPVNEEDRAYILDHFDNLVLKDVDGSEGYGMHFISGMARQEKELFRDIMLREPQRFIAQEVIDYQELDIMSNRERTPRKADVRMFVLMQDEPMVWKSGLTRYAMNPGSYIVNASQGGGFKDTWVLCH